MATPLKRIALSLLGVTIAGLTGTAAHADPELREFCADRPGLNTPACTIDPGHAMIEVGLGDWTLERQPDAQLRVARTFRSLVRDTQTLDLFADTGLPRQVAFTQEALSRLASRLLPEPPTTRDLGDIFDRLFSQSGDGD